MTPRQKKAIKALENYVQGLTGENDLVPLKLIAPATGRLYNSVVRKLEYFGIIDIYEIDNFPHPVNVDPEWGRMDTLVTKWGIKIAFPSIYAEKLETTIKIIRTTYYGETHAQRKRNDEEDKVTF